MAVEHVRVSQKAKDQLIKLKRFTGISHWNVLCRWAFCVSLAEPSIPPDARIPSDSNVEMSWKVFAGKQAALYAALLKERCIRDGMDTETATLANQFRLHLHRGIGYLAGDQNLRSIEALASLLPRAAATK